MCGSKVYAKMEAEDRGVAVTLRSIRMLDVLKNGLHVCPLTNLDPIVELQHRDIVLLIRKALLLLSLNVVETKTAVSQRDTELVLISSRKETFVKQAGLKVERQQTVIPWSKVELAEEIETLVDKFRVATHMSGLVRRASRYGFRHLRKFSRNGVLRATSVPSDRQ
jgi:hypothetical protein